MARRSFRAVAVVGEGRGTRQGLAVLVPQVEMLLLLVLLLVLLMPSSSVLGMLVLCRLEQGAGRGREEGRPFQEDGTAKVAFEDGRGGVVAL